MLGEATPFLWLLIASPIRRTRGGNRCYLVTVSLVCAFVPQASVEAQQTLFSESKQNILLLFIAASSHWKLNKITSFV